MQHGKLFHYRYSHAAVRRRRGRRPLVLLLAVALAVLLSGGCETIGDVGLDRLIDPDIEGRLMPEDMFALSPEHMFSVAYIYGFGFVWLESPAETYDVGTGTVWRISSSDEDEEMEVDSERALLAREADGSTLWYLRVAFEGEDPQEQFELEYEAWLDPDFEVREIAYRDPETGEIVRTTVPEGRRDPREDEDVEDLDSWEQDWEDWWAQAEISRERITVGAGTFDTERLRYEEHDEETGELYRYDVWHTDEVPDRTVQFDYQSLEYEHRSRGELMSIGRDYSRRFF